MIATDGINLKRYGSRTLLLFTVPWVLFAGSAFAQQPCDKVVDCARIAVTAADRAVTAFSTLDKQFRALALQAVKSERREAARNSPTDGNFTASGTCPKGSTIVGYYCQIDSGGGNLQNAGIDTENNSFGCTWNSIGGPFKAWGRAACITLSKE